MRGTALTLLGIALVAVLACAALLGFSSTRQMVLERMPPSWRVAVTALRHGIRVDHTMAITMPDGVRLTVSLYIPKNASQPLPTVLIRTPYHRLGQSAGIGAALFFARHGYAALVQDLRGTGDSGGELLPWRDAAEDGAATLDWIAAQPWSTGKVGTFGCSALGETQFVLARRNHPAHRAMIPSGAGGAVGSAAGRYGYFGLFEGGIFELASGFGWFASDGAKDPKAPAARAFDAALHLKGLPVSGLVHGVRPSPSAYSDFLSTPLGDARWSHWGYLTDEDGPAVPALVISTWGDQTVGDTLALAESWRRRQPALAARQKVVIAPGTHCDHQQSTASADRFGELAIENASRPWQEWYLQWFGHWLRGADNGLASMRAYNYFMLVENRWHEADAWPPEEASAQRWFLDSGGNANTRSGDGVLSPAVPVRTAQDTYTYDPMNPVPTRGGPICCTGNPNEPMGPAEQADVEARRDVLVYTSAPLASDLRVAGTLKARIAFSSSAPDTDLVVRLVHVWPDGRALSMQEGALRLRYRDGFVSPRLMEAGRRHDVTVDMRSIAWLIPKGHRLRLHVTSSSFPRLERNLNTGAVNNADETRSQVAINAVHHGEGASSWIELPVLPNAP